MELPSTQAATTKHFESKMYETCHEVDAARDNVSVLMMPWGLHSLTVPRMFALAWLGASSITADTR
jgi:hypothetical protein